MKVVEMKVYKRKDGEFRVLFIVEENGVVVKGKDYLEIINNIHSEFKRSYVIDELKEEKIYKNILFYFNENQPIEDYQTICHIEYNLFIENNTIKKVEEKQMHFLLKCEVCI